MYTTVDKHLDFDNHNKTLRKWLDIFLKLTLKNTHSNRFQKCWPKICPVYLHIAVGKFYLFYFLAFNVCQKIRRSFFTWLFCAFRLIFHNYFWFRKWFWLICFEQTRAIKVFRRPLFYFDLFWQKWRDEPLSRRNATGASGENWKWKWETRAIGEKKKTWKQRQIGCVGVGSIGKCLKICVQLLAIIIYLPPECRVSVCV